MPQGDVLFMHTIIPTLWFEFRNINIPQHVI